jgi:DNA replication protein DnaC
MLWTITERRNRRSTEFALVTLIHWPRAAECFAPLADEAKQAGWSHVEYLGKVVAEQAAATVNRRLAARLRYARFPFRRTVGDFDFSFQPSIDAKLVEDLATLRFIEERRPIVFLGQPGCGKTHLAVALATLAVEAGYRGYFTTGDDMVLQLLAAQREGNFAAKLRTYTAPTVLVLDDVGLLPVGAEGAGVFSTSSTPDTRTATPRWLRPTGACRPGGRCSATPWWLRPSWTGSCTGPSCSTSGAPPGGCVSTRPWPRRSRRDPSRARPHRGGGAGPVGDHRRHRPGRRLPRRARPAAGPPEPGTAPVTGAARPADGRSAPSCPSDSQSLSSFAAPTTRPRLGRTRPILDPVPTTDYNTQQSQRPRRAPPVRSPRILLIAERENP